MSDHALSIFGAISGGIGALADIAIVMLMIMDRPKTIGGRRYWPWLIALTLTTIATVAPAYFIYRLVGKPEVVTQSEVSSKTSDIPANETDSNISVDANIPYEVAVNPSWPSNAWIVNRRDGVFTVHFDTAAPPMGATLDWTVIPLPHIARLGPELTKRDEHLRSLDVQVKKLTNVLNTSAGQNAEAQSRISALTNANNSLTTQLETTTKSLDNYRAKVSATVKDIEDQQLPAITKQILKTAENSWRSAADEGARAEQTYQSAKATVDTKHNECKKLSGDAANKCEQAVGQSQENLTMMDDQWKLATARRTQNRAEQEMLAPISAIIQPLDALKGNSN
jgi:plasmid maintenance system antidote protein VapI